MSNIWIDDKKLNFRNRSQKSSDIYLEKSHTKKEKNNPDLLWHLSNDKKLKKKKKLCVRLVQRGSPASPEHAVLINLNIKIQD